MAKSRWSVRALLIGGNVALVLAAVLAVVAAGASFLKRLSDEDALARVGMAGASAARVLESTQERLAGAVRLLADRTILASLLMRSEREGVRELLETCRESGALSGCALVVDQRLYSFAGEDVPWNDLLGAPEGLLLVRSGSPLLLAASSSVRGTPGAVVIGVLALDEPFRSALSKQIGLPVAVLDRASALERNSSPESARQALGRALDSEAEVAARIGESGAYLSVQPLRSRSGTLLGVLETTVPADAASRAAGGFLRAFVGFSIVVAGLAAVLGVLLGRRLVAQLEPPMEDLRTRVLELTTELRRREAQAEAVVAGMLEGVFAVDRERTIRYVNPQVASLLGLPAEGIVGRFCGDVLKPRAEGGVRPCEDRCPILHARFRGSTRAVEHLEVFGGTRAVVITSAKPEAADAEGSLQFQVIRDESDTETTRRLRDAVLANISHEFRTPLSAQLASIELLRDRLSEIEPQEVRDLVLTLERGTLRLTQLIDNLLESVRIESGTDSIRRRPVALDEVIEAAVDMTSPLAALREQTIRVDLPYPLPAVAGDGPRLIQVFVNLLANASKFAPVGTAIRVGGEVRDTEVVLWVEDEGPGLPDLEQAPRFERFHRSPGEEPEESGMGLGLFIVKSIVERHGGRVEVRGGKRTRMCVVLPAAEAVA